jgi:plasmid stability protein
MPKMIQIRHVPDAIHRTLKARAAQEGMSLSDYLLREITLITGRPTVREVMARIEQRGPTEVPEDSVEIIRKLRGR